MINKSDDYIYEELTLDEFSKRFANSPKYSEPSVTDLFGEGVQVCTLDLNGEEVYKDVLSFVVKPSVNHHYTDGRIKVTEDHTFVEGGLEIKAQNHKDFVRVEEPMDVVDIEVDDLHTYLANGRLNHNTTSGGKALGFHASCRIRLKGIGKLKKGKGATEEIVGVQTEAQVIKNRMGPPFRKATFDIYFSSGIDDLNSWLELLKNHDVVKQSGAYYTLVNEETGEEHRFMAKEWKQLVEQSSDLKDYCYRKICDLFIMKYRSQDLIDPNEIAVDDELPE